MDIIQQINNLNTTDILDKFWLKYTLKWNIIEMWEDWKKTDGWRWNTEKKFLNDINPQKNRLTWDNFEIIKKHLLFNDKEAILWSKTNFNLNDTNYINTNWDTKIEEEKIQIDFKKQFENYRDLNKNEIEYLGKRFIDYDKLKDLNILKDNNFLISLPILNIKWEYIWIQNRNINPEFSIRYKIDKWSSLKWYFFKDINKEDKKIIITEWMTDFLTLRQHYSNVIWLVSWNCDLNELKFFYNKWYKIYLISDNDEVWNWVRLKLWEILNNDLYVFDFKKYEDEEIVIKDFNDFITQSGYWKWVEELIFEESKHLKENACIQESFKQMNTLLNLIRTKWRLWVDTPFNIVDKITHWFIEWKVYLIWWFSNTWKSQLMYEYCNFDINKWRKVWIFSLEVWKDFLMINLLRNKHKVDFKELWNMDLDYNDYKDYFKNTQIYDDIYDLWKIIETIEKEKFDIVYIDFLQNINVKWAKDEYTKMSEIALQCQLTAIKTKTTFVNLSQLNNNSRFESVKNATFKGSWSLYFSSDVIFVIWRDEMQEWLLKFYIEKNKFWKRWKMFDLWADFDKCKFNLFEEQPEEEKTI